MTHPLEYPGNVIPQPGMYHGASSVDDEIMASMVGYTQQGVTLGANQGILPAGTVLGRKTADKLWYVYNNAHSDGTEVARGILRKTVNTALATVDAVVGYQANIVVAGIVKNSKVSGADSAAIVDLAARQDTVLDLFRF